MSLLEERRTCDTSKREIAKIMRVRMRPPRNPAGISIIKPLEWSSCVHSNRINIRHNPSRRFQLLCNVKLAINPKCPGNGRIFCPPLPARDAASVDNSSSTAIREVCGTPMALSLVLRAIFFFRPLPHFAALSRFYYFMCIRRENNNSADLTFSDSDSPAWRRFRRWSSSNVIFHGNVYQ